MQFFFDGAPMVKTWLVRGLSCLFLLCLVLLTSCQQPEVTIPVLPDIDGFGVMTPAGRNGQILRVTNLHDSGSGSLRSAVEGTGPRTVIFDVGGTVQLLTDLKIRSPFITIAGQTSPTPGITLRGAGIRVLTNDVLIQHIRVRVGDQQEGPQPDNRDAIQILEPSHDVVLDHVSASWAIDENVSTWGKVSNITISNSIISEALSNSLHSEGEHSKGLLIGDHSSMVFVGGNLFAHNRARNPQIKGGTSVVFVNNLVYDCGSSACVSITDNYAQLPHAASIVGNHFLSGASSPKDLFAIKVEASAKPGTKTYLLDNRADLPVFKNSTTFDPVVGHPPVWKSGLQVKGSEEVLEAVLSFSGARPADRDAVDKRIIEQVRSRQGKIIDSQEQVGGWPETASSFRKFKVPHDPHSDDDRDGYTNLEEALQIAAAGVEGRIVE